MNKSYLLFLGNYIDINLINTLSMSIAKVSTDKSSY